jgi:hypothetical protein
VGDSKELEGLKFVYECAADAPCELGCGCDE